jgi:hypothetical protein
MPGSLPGSASVSIVTGPLPTSSGPWAGDIVDLIEAGEALEDGLLLLG